MDWEDFLKVVADPKFRVQEFALDALRYMFLGKEDELRELIMGERFDSCNL